MQLACPPKNANTCERVRFDGNTISGTVNSASVAKEFVSFAQSGNISANENGARIVGVAAEAVKVAVTTAVAVTMPLSVVEEDEDVEIVVLSARASVTVGSTVVRTVTITTPVSVATVALSSSRVRDETGKCDTSLTCSDIDGRGESCTFIVISTR